MSAPVAAILTRMSRQQAVLVRGLLPFLTDHFKHVNQPIKRRYYRAGCTAAGGVSNTVRAQYTGESAADIADLPVMLTYTSATFGAAGGPQNGHKLVIEETSPGNRVVRGYFP